MTPGDSPVWVETGQVYAVIFAAAVRGATDLRVPVPVRRGTVALPTLGLARLGSAGGYRVAEADSRGGGFRLRLDGRSVEVRGARDVAPDWWRLRRLRLSSGDRTLDVILDDIDPYRDLADPVEPRRLDEPGLASWRDQLAGAWHILERHHQDTAEAMRAGLWSITPLPGNPDWDVRSASTGDAFGAALMSLPPDSTTTAVTMVHELQHNKLGALLHLIDLTDDAGRAPRLYAPWRPDPRPVAGLLQGVYAFLGITAFWRGQRRVGSGAQRRLADFEFALARRQTWAGLRALRAPGELTVWGQRFVEGMASRLRPWLRETVPPGVNRAAWAAFADHRAGWRIRNLEVDPVWVAAAVRAWLDGRDPPPHAAAEVLTRTDRPVWLHRRLSRYRGAPGADGGRAPATSPLADLADALLLQGRADRAESAYHRAIMAQPSDFDAWTGLGLAVAAQRKRREWRALLRRPEFAKALHAALAQVEPAPSPLAVARWLTA
jgi:HEXXH motif-containing protein